MELLLLLLLHLVGSPGIAADRPPVQTGPVTASLPTDSAAWFERPPLPRARAHQMVATWDPGSTACCLVFGGRRSLHGSMDQACLRYTHATQDWSECAPMGVRRGIGQAVVVDDYVYVLGGCREFGHGLTAVEVYDPAANTWAAAPGLPESLHDFSAVAWRDSLVYVLGGGNWSPNSPPGNRVWLFNPAAGTWVAATPLPVGVGASSAGIFDDHIYLATGWTDSGPTNRAWIGIIDPDRPSRLEWLELDTLPGARRCRTASTHHDDRLYVVGGILPDGSVTAETWVLDRRSGAWQRLPDKPAPTANVAGAALLRDWLLVPGGYPGTAPYLADHDGLYLGNHVLDAAVHAITSPRGRLAGSSPRPVAAVFANAGQLTTSCLARMTVTDSAAQQIVFSAESTLVLEPDETMVVEFGEFVPELNRILSVRASVFLDGDQNPDNDTLSAAARTTAGSVPDAFGYVYESTQEPDTITFGWISPDSGDTITGWEPDPDDGITVRGLPFGFPFYDDTLEHVRVSVDGFLQLSEVVNPTNRSLPFFEMSDIIAPFWDDLTLRAAGAAIENSGTDFVCFTWQSAPRYGAPDDSLTFQVVLYPNGIIRFNYLDMNGMVNSATVGIQGRDGGDGWYLEYVFDGEPGSHLPADSVSIAFHHPRSGAVHDNTGAATATGRVLCPTVWRGRLLPLTLDLPGREQLAVALYDATGRRLTRLDCPPGSVNLELVGPDGRALPAGAYFVRVSAPGLSLTRKVLLPHR